MGTKLEKQTICSFTPVSTPAIVRPQAYTPTASPQASVLARKRQVDPVKCQE
ncbi:hypothetical protein P7K49_036015 [Saguinus oedipus]|uniref:Uncharacterized protein n=1 Tax=Saguinus oedipus TaxID=9490 RepID=A0ABQ9TQ08_SAGOE|nr:hypothetical protein P7K49_036015 [Saguinus oedipus]